MLKFGADPEVFAAVNINGKNVVVSPALLEDRGLIKPIVDDQKHPIFINNKEFRWHMDGVAFELTIKKPYENWRDIFRVTKLSLESLGDYLSSIKFDGLQVELKVQPVIDIVPSMYDLANKKIWQGFIFGCDPDKDALISEYSCKTLDVSEHKKRYGGGHIHISGEDDLYNFPRPAIMCLAVTVGCFTTFSSLFHDLDKERVNTYGRPGRYRQQKYSNGDLGIEYRSPSNSWILLDESGYEELFYWASVGVSLLVNKEGEKVKNNIDIAVKAIIDSDKDLAKNVLENIESKG